jgi:hypothetical protein
MSLFDRQLTIGELLNIDHSRQEKARYCSVELEYIYHELKPQGVLEKFQKFFGKKILNTYYVIFKFRVTSDTGREHVVIIRVNPDFNLHEWEYNKIKIYCGCNDFKYRSAFILNKNKSLFINSRTSVDLGAALVDPPKKQHPTLLCKHAFAALQWLVNNYSSVMRSI